MTDRLLTPTTLREGVERALDGGARPRDLVVLMSVATASQWPEDILGVRVIGSFAVLRDDIAYLLDTGFPDYAKRPPR